MIRRQKDIDAQNREMDALADRWELRIHAIALTITAVVLGMRLVAGRQDLTSDVYGDEPSPEPSVAALPASEPTAPEPAASGAPELPPSGDRGTRADSPTQPDGMPSVSVP